MYRSFDSRLINLETPHETNNPIAYNLNQLKYHDPIRLDGFEAIFVSKAASIEVFEGHHKTFETETDLPDFTDCEPKDIIRQQNDPKPLKPIRTSRFAALRSLQKGF
jgi:hypothetical protein